MGRFLVFMGLLLLGFIVLMLGANRKLKEKAERLENDQRFNREFNKFHESKNEMPHDDPV